MNFKGQIFSPKKSKFLIRICPWPLSSKDIFDNPENILETKENRGIGSPDFGAI